jgi:hypothetical protein
MSVEVFTAISAELGDGLEQVQAALGRTLAFVGV